jgi:hypothetical protein
MPGTMDVADVSNQEMWKSGDLVAFCCAVEDDMKLAEYPTRRPKMHSSDSPFCKFEGSPGDYIGLRS